MQHTALSNKFIYVLFAELVLLFGGIIFVTRGLDNLKSSESKPALIKQDERKDSLLKQHDRIISDEGKK